MKPQLKTVILAAVVAAASGSSAFAHLTYSGRSFGTLAADGSPVTLTTSISSDYGWAYATDANLGDSHRTRAFSFTLAEAGLVTIQAQGTGANPLLPAYSVYSGLAHVAPQQSDHDTNPSTLTYLNSVYGSPNNIQGAFNALGNWAIGNTDTYNVAGDPNSGVLYAAALSYFSYVGNAADGSSANYGSALGINGDNNADSYVTGSFYLGAGSYTIIVGGARYVDAPETPVSYGANVTVSFVPEPSSALMVGVSVLGLALRRRRCR